MTKRHTILFLLFFIIFLVTTGLPKKNKASGEDVIAGRNVNMVAGTQLPHGDPWLQRQNEPSIAVSTRNPLHLLAGANDYRTIDIPGKTGDELPGQEEKETALAPREPWLGVFKSFDGGQSWISTLLPGFPQDESSEGWNSPLYQMGYHAAADPVVRAGTNGLFYYSGIAFNRDTMEGVVFVSRFIDNNNKEKNYEIDNCIKYLDTKIIAQGLGGLFLDKPWIAVDLPHGKGQTVTIDGQSIPQSNVYIAFSEFSGEGDTLESKIRFSCSTDCGENWNDPIEISKVKDPNQGAAIAVDPRGNGHVYVAWRQFGKENQSDDAIFITRSTNSGKKFHKAVEVASFYPFDQGSSGATFRTNSYPTLAIDDSGRLYLAWSQRMGGPLGDARIVLSTLKDGKKWSKPEPIDDTGVGHQIMPSLTFAAGKLMMVWYDQREDISQRFTEYINDLSGQTRHTLDVRVAQAEPGIDPIFEPSKQVSRYLFVLEGVKENYTVKQVQFNPVNFPLFKTGTWPFMGDYIDIAPSPMFVLDDSGHWRYNTDPSNTAVFHAAWTDNRDVRPPLDGIWQAYSPPRSDQVDPNFYTDNFCSDWKKTGMRNQNIYTSRITQGIIVGSPGNTKPLGTLGETPDGEKIPRSFVVFVKNTFNETKSFRLTIANQPPDGRASFLEFDLLDWLDIEIAPHSSISRSVFVYSSEKYATVKINVAEIYEPYGQLIPDGLESSVILNPDIQNPDIQNPDIQNPDIQNPDIQNAEVHNPDIINIYVNPDIMNPDIQNPDIMNPDIQNPDIMNPDIMNPDIQNPDIQNPDIMNPDIQNPDIQNPDIMNPDIMNTTIADPSAGDFIDVIWDVQNTGNTTSSFVFKTLSTAAQEDGTLPEGIQAQLLIYRVYSTPNEYNGPGSCNLGKQEHQELTLNIINPDIQNPDIQNVDLTSPDIQNPDIMNATFSLEPEGVAKVILRLWKPFSYTESTVRALNTVKTLDFNNPNSIMDSFIGFTSGTAGNTEDREKGITTYRTDTSLFLITTKILAAGEVGKQYSDFLQAAGGTKPLDDPTWNYGWAIVVGDLPPGLQLNPINPGQIDGTPEKAGTYSFTAQATDYEGQTCTKDLWITISPSGVTEYTISGRITVGSSGLEGVVMNGLPGNPTTDSVGYYTTSVESDWSGTVTPSKTGYIFSPMSKSYSDISENKTGENYTATLLTYTISGEVTADSSGLADVVMNGLPGNPYTDTSGIYSATVQHGWSGTVTPTLEEYEFTPSSRTYSNVNSDMTTEQNYTATPLVGPLDYFIVDTPATGIVGTPFSVTITAKDSAGNTTTNVSGATTLSVDGDGTITPTSIAETEFTVNGVWTGNVTLSESGSRTITATNNGNIGSDTIIITAGVASTIWIEDVADGTGIEVDTMTIPLGGSFTVYAILRDIGDNFIDNAAATWSLINETGGVGGGDLVPAEEKKSATFTGHGEGTAKIAVYYLSLNDETGTIAVTGTPPDDIYDIYPEDNDDFGSAADITTGTFTNLQLLDDDWYKIYVPGNMVLKVSIAGVLGNDIDLGLADSAGKYLVGGLSSSNEDTIYFNTTSSSDYYIRVPYTWGEGLQNTYTLTAEISDSFGQGQVFGRVTDHTNNPLHVRVRVFDRYGNWKWNTLTDATTGEYRISIPAGSYKIRFITYPILDYYGGINYLRKFYGDKFRFVEAPLIEVLSGENLLGIDGQLGQGGAIAGTVTDPQGNAIEGAFIRVRNLDGYSAASAYSDELGQYTVERLTTGYFKAFVRSWTENHGIEWYNDKPSFNEANAIYVETGQTASGRDFQLTEGGNVEGRVTDINGGVGGVQVVAIDPSQTIPFLYPSGNIPQIGLRSTSTDDNGYYFMNHLPTGDVSLYFNTSNTNHVPEWYDDALYFEDSVPVPIQAGQTTSGINVELAESGAIGGRVTNSSGEGIKDVIVWIFNLEGGGYYQKYASTNDDGYYRIDRIPVGKVKVRFRPNIYTSPPENWAVEWYGNKNSYVEADEVTVIANETTWGIDAVLAANGGRIEGYVKNSDLLGIGGVYVSAYDSSIQAQVSFVYTNADGYYSVPRIPTCDVKLVFFTGNNRLPYVSEFYNDGISYEEATPVSVILGQTETLPDVVLSDRPNLAVTTASLPNGVVGTPYSQALVAEGGTKHYHWSLDSGSLPNGLYLKSTGVIEGTPTAQEIFNFTVKVVDFSYPPQEAFSQNLSITINPYTGSDFIISGNVTFEGSPLGGVFMEGLPNNTNTNASGGYIAIVSSGWSGTVTPTLPDYAFTPLYRSYNDVMTNQINQDYTASVGLTISGSIRLDGDGLPGVLMSGLPGNPTTDENGNYTATIPSGWSGTVIPSKAGHAFDPYNRIYVSETSNQIGQDYQATLITAEWVASYNGPAANSYDNAVAVATDLSGNIYVTGSSNGSGTSRDYATIKYDSDGNQLWEARYNGPGNSNDYSSAIAVDSAGNVYVTGYSGYRQAVDYATIKYNSNGNQVWVARYDGPGNNIDRTVAIAVDSYGNVYVTGYSYDSTGGNQDYATVKYNSNGDQVWVARYDGPANATDRPADIAVDFSDNIYVTGESYGDGTYYDYATIKYNSNGDQVWVAIHDNGSNDTPDAIALDTAGNVYVSGQSYRSGTSYDYATIKYDSLGNQDWIAWYDNDSNSDQPQALALDSSGNVYVTGYSRVYTEGGPYYDYATVRYDNDGGELWATTYDGPGYKNDMAYAVDVDSAGNVYVTGRSLGSNEFNEYATVKYSSTGSELWVKRYDGSANGNDTANAIVVDSFGNIVVTGSSHGSSTNNDYATIKYDSDGGQLWNTEGDGAVRYNGPTNDENMNWLYGDIMAMDSFNNVYMSGYSYGNGTDLDYTTVKFDSDGDQVWATRYNGPGNYIDYAEDMAVDLSGNVYVTGVTYINETNRDYATVKYDSAGNQEWAVTYDGPENGYDWAYAIALDTDGNVYVTGESLGTDTSADCTTIKYNGDTGYQEWEVTYNGPDNSYDEGWGIIVDTDGNVYVTGRTYKGSSERYDFLTIKYDSASGGELWVRTYNSPENENDNAYFITLDSSNNVYVCGDISDDYGIVKYNSAGVEQWVARYDGPGNGYDYPMHLVVDSVDNVYVTGRSTGNGTYYDFATVKYDSNGNELWARRYEGESTGSYDYGSGIAFDSSDSSGNVYVTGRSGGTDTQYDGDCITIKYDSDGNPLRIMKYNGPGNGVDGGISISVTSSGDVYVAGIGVGIGTGIDFIVIKYRK